MKYNKLIRDRMPEIMAKDGKRARTHKADDAEYLQKLKAKLIEESAEYSRDEKTEELADVLEVLYALLDFKGVSKGDVESMRKRKAEERGTFTQRIVLDEVV